MATDYYSNLFNDSPWGGGQQGSGPSNSYRNDPATTQNMLGFIQSGQRWTPPTLGMQEQTQPPPQLQPQPVAPPQQQRAPTPPVAPTMAQPQRMQMVGRTLQPVYDRPGQPGQPMGGPSSWQQQRSRFGQGNPRGSLRTMLTQGMGGRQGMPQPAPQGGPINPLTAQPMGQQINAPILAPGAPQGGPAMRPPTQQYQPQARMMSRPGGF